MSEFPQYLGGSFSAMYNGAQAATIKPSAKSSGAASSRAGHLPHDSDGNTSPIVGATAVLAAKYPSKFQLDRDRKSRRETRMVVLFLLVVLGIIGYSWSLWAGINFTADGDFHYNSGLIGGIMMLVVLFYAVIKRMKFLRKVGKMEIWYYIHLIGGIAGPILIVYHSSFQLKAVNSTVAFISMLLIVASGFVGRYFYTRVGYTLHRRLLEIKETEQNVVQSLRGHNNEIAYGLERRLANFALACLAGPKTILQMPLRLLAIRTEATKCYVISADELTRMLKWEAQEAGWTVEQFNERLKEEKRIIRQHINAVVDIARIHIWERVLVRWRSLHIPLLYILLITGLLHVLAVHMY